jgi:hypothetical protein
MRVILTSFLLVLAAPTIAQQNVTNLPPGFLTQNPLADWKVQAQSSTPVEQMQLALRWAQEPSDLQARSFQGNARTPRRSTVGQTSHYPL